MGRGDRRPVAVRLDVRQPHVVERGGGHRLFRIPRQGAGRPGQGRRHRRRPDFRSEEHTSELQSLMRISYAVFCLKKKKTTTRDIQTTATNKEKVIHKTAQ